MSRTRKVVWGSVGALSLYLMAEACLAPASQPSACLSLALIRAYQATGSHAMESAGVRCRYTPTCSHYAADAIAHYGTLNGGMRAAGRLLRCAPWGGTGYDPAVETHPAAYVAPQETDSNKKKEPETFKEAWEQIPDKDKAEMRKGLLGCLASGIGCAVFTLGIVAVKIFLIIWVFKDAKARGDQNAVIWIIVLLFTNIIGLIIYLCIRPAGDLSPCANCKQRRLATLPKCPHCGTDTGAAAAPPKA